MKSFGVGLNEPVVTAPKSTVMRPPSEAAGSLGGSRSRFRPVGRALFDRSFAPVGMRNRSGIEGGGRRDGWRQYCEAGHEQPRCHSIRCRHRVPSFPSFLSVCLHGSIHKSEGAKVGPFRQDDPDNFSIRASNGRMLERRPVSGWTIMRHITCRCYYLTHFTFPPLMSFSHEGERYCTSPFTGNISSRKVSEAVCTLGICPASNPFFVI
jgi:hypothetical protein